MKLEDALKEKLMALEDRLNILTQLRDSEQRAADSEAFIKIMKVLCKLNFFAFRCNIKMHVYLEFHALEFSLSTFKVRV